MIKKTKALVAAGAGAAVLLASGATFALWQDSDTLAGATVNTGNLAINATQISWYDVSRDLGVDNDDGIAIELPGFLLVPGDVIEGRFDDGPPLVTIFDGNNIAVQLQATNEAGDVLGTWFARPNAYDSDLSVPLTSADGEVLVFDEFVGSQIQFDGGFSATQLYGLVPVIDTDGTVTLDWSTPNPDVLLTNSGTTGGVNSSISLADLTLTLTQIRPADYIDATS